MLINTLSKEPQYSILANINNNSEKKLYYRGIWLHAAPEALDKVGTNNKVVRVIIGKRLQG